VSYGKRFSVLNAPACKASKFKSADGSTGQKSPGQSGLVKVESLYTPCELTLTTHTARQKLFTEFSALRCGYSREKLFPDRKKLLPQQQLASVIAIALHLAANNNAVANNLKTAQMKDSHELILIDF
jgi:hypothetical protein